MLAGLPSERAWGDGHTTRRRHIIGAMVYGAAASTLTCATDGTTLTADTPEALEVLWQEHGGRLLETEAEEPLTLDPLEAQARGREAMARIVQLGLRCTCREVEDIRFCPNYVPGDENEEPDSE